MLPAKVSCRIQDSGVGHQAGDEDNSEDSP